MATVLDPLGMKTPVPFSLPQGKPAPISVEPPRASEIPAEDAEAGLDWFLIRVCIACGLLLVGMHIYELIRWMIG